MAKNKKAYPPSTKEVIFYTEEGGEKVKHNGFFVSNINKYITNVNRWKDTDTNKWYDDDAVIQWSYLPRI